MINIMNVNLGVKNWQNWSVMAMTDLFEVMSWVGNNLETVLQHLGHGSGQTRTILIIVINNIAAKSSILQIKHCSFFAGLLA